MELVALTVHEGIEGYRDESLAACRELVGEVDVDHEVVTYEQEFGVRMDRVVEDDPEDMAPCAYCGVFRRDVLARYAEELDVDLLLTGHSLDDEAQTALMNLLEGNLAAMAKHYDASLGPLGDRPSVDRTGGRIGTTGAFVSRAKPLRDVPEREVGLYAHLRDLLAHVVECPHASEAYRGEVREHLHELEEHHPGTRHSVLAGYEEIAAMAVERFRETPDGEECAECSAPTTGDGDRCRKCTLLTAL